MVKTRMATRPGFIKTLEELEGKRVDIYLVSGKKLDNIKIVEVKGEKVVGETKKFRFYIPPENIEYLKKNAE